MLNTLQTRVQDGPPIAFELAPQDRVYRLREQYWAETYRESISRIEIAGCGEDTQIGHARDFSILLSASDPFIQSDELIVGSCLAVPQDPKAIDLGRYDPHFPPGHHTLLRLGLPGIRDQARTRQEGETDPDRCAFLRAVEIAYDAACTYVTRYTSLAADLAAVDVDSTRRSDLERIATACRELTAGPPTSFHAALQLVQFTRVFGGRGCIGRLDQWLYPFYEQDLAQGRMTHDEAQELLECAFIKMNEFGSGIDNTYQAPNDNLRNIALAGQTSEGKNACNALTYMCLKASAVLMLPEPKLNVRFFHNSPSGLLKACCHVLAMGANVLAIFNDEVVLPALARLGIPIEDARDYCNDGCSEIIIGGKGTIAFRVHDALSALRETVLGVTEHPYTSFDEVVADFKDRLTAYMPEGPMERYEITYPFFAAAIEDCLTKASSLGARYPIYGSILAEVGNAADSLAAIEQLIYKEGTLTWDELVSALKVDYIGHEVLRQRLLHRTPKYGNDDDRVDLLAAEIAEYFCDGVHARGGNLPGPGPKWAAGLMCFGIHHKSELPASPDGRRKGNPCANSFSPAVGMDRCGPTAVLKSVSKVDLTKASHGSVLDIALHAQTLTGTEEMHKFESLIEVFLELPCTATLQMNIIDRETLLQARECPDDPKFQTLIVRVWGFSAVFVELPPTLQDHVLARTVHRI